MTQGKHGRFGLLTAFLALCLAIECAGLRALSAEGGTIRVRAVFIGDIMIHAQQLEAACLGESWDFKPHFRRVRPLFERSLSVGNLETVFAGEARAYAGYPKFNTPDELAPALVNLGIDAVMLANNHILDQGLDAALRTTKVLDGAGISWTGLTPRGARDDPGEPLVMEYGGLKWAFVNYAYGSNIPRQPVQSEDLRLNLLSDAAIASGLARTVAYEPDITVAFFHWGAEYQVFPSGDQRRAAMTSLKNGADLVIGTHPHVLQPIEVTDSESGPSVVAYSLGNFVSFQRTLPRERSVVLAIDVEKEPGKRARVSRVSVAPTWVSTRRESGRRKVEAVYAGSGGPFNHAGLPAGEVARARKIGKEVLDFLGVRTEPDPDGFYTLWETASPDRIR